MIREQEKEEHGRDGSGKWPCGVKKAKYFRGLYINKLEGSRRVTPLTYKSGTE